jgi:hypothetical protein
MKTMMARMGTLQGQTGCRNDNGAYLTPRAIGKVDVMVLVMCWQVLEPDDETHAEVDDEDVVESGTRFWRDIVGQTWRASRLLACESPRRASGGKGISKRRLIRSTWAGDWSRREGNGTRLQSARWSKKLEKEEE